VPGWALPYYNPVRAKVLQLIREQGLLQAGDRVAVAVSGGADSVALLRVLLELKAELGIVLSVAHFNHSLRGEQSDADEAFVADLAKEAGLEIFVGHGDVREHANVSKLSIEAAARQLRYRWFAELACGQRLDAVATAHSLDDQAETVLLKFLRGAGTRGLAGIYPVMQSASQTGSPAAPGEKQIPCFVRDDNDGEGSIDLAADTLFGKPSWARQAFRIVRPLLGVSRSEVESYLPAIGQTWREDESNLDRRFLRNRVRHDLLPLLEREFNPNIRPALNDLADIARGEEEYWQDLIGRELCQRTAAQKAQLDAGQKAACLRLNGFAELPVAVQRRLLKHFAEEHGLVLDFESIARLRRCALGQLPQVELPGSVIAKADGFALSLGQAEDRPIRPYRCVLPIPGELHIEQASLRLRAHVVALDFAREADPGTLLSADLIGPQLIVRNWLPGDRFWPAHHRSEDKLKRLFLEKKVPAVDRPAWPVALCGDRIVWVRGFPVATAHQWRGSGEAVQIEVLEGPVERDHSGSSS
jgi:tRNA(Ile)-lysidine synthase